MKTQGVGASSGKRARKPQGCVSSAGQLSRPVVVRCKGEAPCSVAAHINDKQELREDAWKSTAWGEQRQCPHVGPGSRGQGLLTRQGLCTF